MKINNRSRRLNKAVVGSHTHASAHRSREMKPACMTTLNRFIVAACLSLPVLAGSTADAAAQTLTTTAASPSTQVAAASTIGYDITIHTANVSYAGTDGNVWLRVNGSNGSTQYWYLDDAADNFERNRNDHFLRSGAGVGAIRSITIYFDPRGGADAEWLPDRITVNGVVFRNTSWFMKGSPTDKTFWA